MIHRAIGIVTMMSETGFLQSRQDQNLGSAYTHLARDITPSFLFHIYIPNALNTVIMFYLPLMEPLLSPGHNEL